MASHVFLHLFHATFLFYFIFVFVTSLFKVMALISNKTISHFVSDRLQSMRENGIMLDLTVIVNRERKLRAHKLVLASVSVFSQEVFSNTENPIDVFETNDCALDGVEVLLDYAYGELNTDDNRLQNKLLEVIEVAWRFQAPGLINFVRENVTAECCLLALESVKKEPQKSTASEASKKILFDIWKSKLTFETWASSSQEVNHNNKENLTVSEIGNKLAKPKILLKVESSGESSDFDYSEDSNNCTKPLISPEAGSASNSVKEPTSIVAKVVTISSESSSSESSSECEEEDTKSKQSNKTQSNELQLENSNVETQKLRLSSESDPTCITLKKLSNEKRSESNIKSIKNQKQSFGILKLSNNSPPRFSDTSSFDFRWLYLTFGTNTDLKIKSFNLPFKYGPRKVSITIYNTSTGILLRNERGVLNRKTKKYGKFELRKPFKLSHFCRFYTVMVEYLSAPYFEPVPDNEQIVKNRETIFVRTHGRDVVFRFSPQAFIDNALVEKHSFPRIQKVLFSLTPPEQWDTPSAA